MVRYFFSFFGSLLLHVFLLFPTFGQSTIVSGKVTDAETGEVVPFANVIFVGAGQGITTDFEGKYEVTTSQAVDSIRVSYIGYVAQVRPIERGIRQTINFQLFPDIVNLQEIVIEAGENPAFELLRKVQENKEQNDRRNLIAYDYESYSKLEVDMHNMDKKFRERWAVKKIFEVVDSLDQITDESGAPILPLFISEALSRVYQKNNPELSRENIIKTQITGVGFDNNSYLSQLIGNSIQDFNFYQNWMTIAYKEFISPLATTGRLYYDYSLSDSVWIEEDFCYRLDVYPKSEQDLAFHGTVWITKDEYALKQLDLTITEAANLNYINKVKIQQALTPAASGHWMPAKTRILMEILPLKNSPGMLAKSYVSNRDFQINQPKPAKYYETFVDMAEDARVESVEFWEQNRHDDLSEVDLQVYAMIDTINNIPRIKTYVDIIDIAINGYKTIGKVDIGPYLFAYAFNNIEGSRFQLGFRTNPHFSNKWKLKGYGAYGTGDGRFKYGASVGYILSRKPWTEFTVLRSEDIDQVGLFASDLIGSNNIFYSFSRFGTLVRPYWNRQNRLSVKTAINRGITQKVTLVNKEFDPLFDFAYKQEPSDANSPISSKYTTTEVRFETRFARDARYIEQWNERVSVGLNRWPVFTIRYTLGLENFLGGDFNYHRLDGSVTQDLKMGFFGTSTYELKAGHIFNQLPYPLLEVHIGNESPFYTTAAYNTMNFFEFVSDSYASLRYQHAFQGFIMNRIPLMKKLKWRLVANANVLYGSTRQENRDIIAETDAEGNPIPGFGYLDKGKPFIELGYGIENIFKVARVDAFHRLTYLDNPDVSKFTVKISFQIIL